MNIAASLPFIGTLSLALCAGLLIYQSLQQMPDPVGQQQDRSITAAIPQGTSAQNRSLILPAARPDVFYAAITERPLFVPSRRPILQDAAPEPIAPTPVAPVVAPTIASPDNLSVSGILGSGTNATVFVIDGDSDGEWLRLNDDINGWTISEIGPDWITLTTGEDRFRLELFE